MLNSTRTELQIFGHRLSVYRNWLSKGHAYASTLDFLMDQALMFAPSSEIKNLLKTLKKVHSPIAPEWEIVDKLRREIWKKHDSHPTRKT